MFKDIEKMKRDKYKLIREARNMLEKASNQNRSLSTWEKDRYDDLMDEVKSMDQEINEEERSQKEEMRGSSQKQAAGTKGPEYRSLFKSAGLERGGFETFGEFLRAIESGRSDPRLEKLEARQLNIDTGAQGGFAVPTEFASWLVDGSLEDEVIRPRANVFEMKAKQRRVPAWDNLDRSSDLYGGINAEWTAENQQRSDQMPALREIVLEAEKLILYVSASREVIQDATELENELMKAMRKALSYEMDNAFLTGSGTGSQPRGILNDPARLDVNRGDANEVNYQDLVNLYSRLVKGGRPQWVVSHSALPQLMTMTDANNNLIWQPNARDGSPGQLLGMPVYLSEKLPELGSRGDVILVDPSRYLVGMRQEIVLDASTAPGWFSDYYSWRCVLRVAGQGAWDKPLTLADGSTQLSWAVILDVA